MATDPPPTKPVSIKEVAVARESTGGWHGSGLAPTPASKVSDGLGDAPQAWGSGYISTGAHLLQKDGSSGVIALDAVSLSAASPTSTELSNGSGTDWMGGSAGATLTVSIDSRAITLSRDGARSPGKVYSPDGQLHGEYVDQSGVAHGETTYSTQTPNWQYFHPAFAGAWSQKTGYDDLGRPSGTVPDVTWAWSPNESEDTWYIGKCEMPNSSITYNSDGTISGKSAGSVVYPVGYAATDNADKAIGTASYALTVHDEWDNLRLDPSHPFDVIDNDVLVTVGGHEITQENDASSTPDPVGPLSVSCTATATLGFSPTGSFKIGNLLTLGVTFQASVAVAGTVGEQITGPPIPPKSYIQLYFHTHYHRNHYLVDHYTASGYDQTYTEIVDATPDIAELHWGHSNTLPF